MYALNLYVDHNRDGYAVVATCLLVDVNDTRIELTSRYQTPEDAIRALNPVPVAATLESTKKE